MSLTSLAMPDWTVWALMISSQGSLLGVPGKLSTWETLSQASIPGVSQTGFNAFPWLKLRLRFKRAAAAARTAVPVMAFQARCSSVMGWKFGPGAPADQIPQSGFFLQLLLFDPERLPASAECEPEPESTLLLVRVMLPAL